MNRISRDLRIAVVGTSGCSALSAVLSRHLEIPRIVIQDSEQKDDPFASLRARTAAAAAGPSWIIEANDQAIRELVWPRATMIVWLDYRLSRNLFEKLRRAGSALRARFSRPRGRPVPVKRSGAEFELLLDERCVRLRSLSDVLDWLRDVAR
jgi:hypothetical protein